jgi:hypothetical protein
VGHRLGRSIRAASRPALEARSHGHHTHVHFLVRGRVRA